jgi:holo-[acyl-carrier protein] synthase
MIYGIGTDLVHIRRIDKVIRRWGERFIHRIYTSDEIKICYSRAFPPSAFALRFAAKEAFSKAVGLGMRKGVRWRDIEVFHFTGGRPGLRLHGRSSDICQEEKITGFHLSLSDEGDYAIAMVVLEKSDETSQSR